MDIGYCRSHEVLQFWIMFLSSTIAPLILIADDVGYLGLASSVKSALTLIRKCVNMYKYRSLYFRNSHLHAL
eukprot:5345032-Pleurochrysis_carterae.AAC.4